MYHHQKPYFIPQEGLNDLIRDMILSKRHEQILPSSDSLLTLWRQLEWNRRKLALESKVKCHKIIFVESQVHESF